MTRAASAARFAGAASAGAAVADVRRVMHHAVRVEMRCGRDSAAGRTDAAAVAGDKRARRTVRPRLGRLVLDLPAGAAPDVVPVELRLGLDVGVVERLGVFAR